MTATQELYREGWDEYLVPNNSNHPYGVEVGDRVHFWPGNPPPLSMDYVAPPCLPALVIGFTAGTPPWCDVNVWMADLAVVDPATEELRVIRRVPQAESFAQTGLRDNKSLSEPSYGVHFSWHKHHPETAR